MWIIIYLSSIYIPIFLISPLIYLILVIHSSDFLLTIYSYHLVISCVVLSCNSLWLAQIFLKVSSTLVLSLFTYYYFFRFQQSGNRPCLFLWVSAYCGVYFWVTPTQKVLLLFFSVLSARVFLSPVSKTIFLVSRFCRKIYGHIHHVSFSPIKSLLMMPFLSELSFLVFSSQNLYWRTGFHIVLRSMLERSNKSGAYTYIYALKVFFRVFQGLSISRLLINYFFITIFSNKKILN